MNRNKRVLIHSLIFSPDGVSTAYLYNDIALKLQERGYEVLVLTATPHFNIVPDQVKTTLHWKVWGFCKVSNFNGMTVLHVPRRSSKSCFKTVGICLLALYPSSLGMFIRHVDLIPLSISSFALGYINLGLAKLKG